MTLAADGVEWTVTLDDQALAVIWMGDGYEPMYRRIFAEAARQDLGYGPSTGQEARP